MRRHADTTPDVDPLQLLYDRWDEHEQLPPTIAQAVDAHRFVTVSELRRLLAAWHAGLID